MRALRRTKIVCTLGPSSSDKKTIRALIEAGMDVARLNMSHGTQDDHHRLISIVREQANVLGLNVSVLMDLQGPKIRIGEIPDGPVYLEKGDFVELTGHPIEKSTSERLYIDYASLSEDVSIGKKVLIDDGNLELVVSELRGDVVVAEVLIGGIVTSRKGVNLPNIRTTIPSLTEKDLRDIDFGLEHQVDIVALSFVRDPSDVTDLVQRLGGPRERPSIIAKIEKPEAVANFDKILTQSDGIMVARGDLGIEMRLSQVPGTQKTLIRKCIQAAKPVITATQMLESMMGNPRPTRAEVSDVANAVIDGTDAVMLSGETAAGSYPIRSVEVMAGVIEEIEKYCETLYTPGKKKSANVSDAIAASATELAEKVGAVAIACMTASGNTARSIASHRPSVPVYAFTDDQRVVGQVTLTWGTKGFYIPFQSDTDDGISRLLAKLVEHDLAARGDLIVVTAGMPLPAKGRSNTVHVSKI